MLPINRHRRRRLLSFFILPALMVCFAAGVRAQSALDGFDPNANGAIEAVVVHPDGKILIGGSFTTLSPNGGAAVTRNRIARLNPDGTLDAAFDPNADNTVYAIAIQTDGKILAGGSFNTIGGQTRHRVARLDAATGAADSFDPNSNGFIKTMAVQADGKILVGGTLQNIGGQARNYIARLDPATGLADSFDPHSNSLVLTIVVQPDGKILVGGAYGGTNSIGGQARNHIARLDPVTGMADPWDPNSSVLVQAIAIQADGKILVGGTFFNVGGQNRNRIARLDPATGMADSFDPNADNTVVSIAVQADGKILVGGGFTTIGGQTRNHIARLDPVTGLADSFDPNANGTVNSIAVQQDGKILAGGSFTSLSPNSGAVVIRNNIAELETDGTADVTIDPNVSDGEVDAIALQSDNNILIGGRFTGISGQGRGYIARLNADGSLDASFHANPNFYVYSIAIQSDGKILIGGRFNIVNGESHLSLARLNADGTLDTSFTTTANNDVYSIVAQPDGKILIVGRFGSAGGQPRSRVARLNVDGSLDLSFDPNANNDAYSIALQSDGKIIVGGGFTTIGGQTRNRIARLNSNGSVDATFDPNASGTVIPMAVQSDGKVLVGGLFTAIAGQARNHITRINTDGTIDASFDPNANGTVHTISVQSDGRILIGGYFTTVGGQTRRHIARLNSDGTVDPSFNDLAVSNNSVFSISIQSDGKILAGGDFTSISGEIRNRIARLTNDIPMLQNLAVSQTSINWELDGAAPLFTRTTFEESMDGVNYTILGAGTGALAWPMTAATFKFRDDPTISRTAFSVASGPLASGWTLNGLNLPAGQNIFIRARGFYRGGYSDGSESILERVQNVYFAPIASVSGTVTYGNAIGAPMPRVVSTVLLSGSGSVPVSGLTGFPDGTYSLSGFGAGGYVVTPSKTGGVNGAITSFDAGKIAQHAAGVSTLTGNQLVVADVSGNGAITSFDAAQVARYAAGLNNSGATGNWIFMPVNRSYASVTGNIAGEDFIALLMGEVSGNWMNTGAR